VHPTLIRSDSAKRVRYSVRFRQQANQQIQLLGTCAYLLRSFKRHIRDQTYIPHYANSARFIIAAIGGAVVGLFNNFSITQGPSISPLAVAFLVGYAVDVFYTFLDGLLQKFIKNGLVPVRGHSKPASKGRN